MKKQSKLEINISFLYYQNTYAEKKTVLQIENLKCQGEGIYIYTKRKIMTKLNIHLKFVLASYQVWLLWQKLWELFDKNKQFDTCHIIFYWNRILHLIFTQPILKKIEIVQYCMFSFGYF